MLIKILSVAESLGTSLEFLLYMDFLSKIEDMANLTFISAMSPHPINKILSDPCFETYYIVYSNLI